MRDKYVMIYNGEGNRWSLVDRDEIIDRLYSDSDSALFLEEKFKELTKSLDKFAKVKFNRFVEAQDDEDTQEKIKEDIKLLLYNNKEIPINTRRQLDLNKEI